MKRILLFTTSYCMPCKAVKRLLEAHNLLGYTDIIDCMERPNEAIKRRIKHVPVIILKDGEEETRMQEIDAAEIEKWLHEES